jgi:hypothetical protein
VKASDPDNPFVHWALGDIEWDVHLYTCKHFVLELDDNRISQLDLEAYTL